MALENISKQVIFKMQRNPNNILNSIQDFKHDPDSNPNPYPNLNINPNHNPAHVDAGNWPKRKHIKMSQAVAEVSDNDRATGPIRKLMQKVN